MNFHGRLFRPGAEGHDRQPTARLIASIPEALATTDLVCSSVNVASTRAGIDMDAVALMGKAIKGHGRAAPETGTASAAPSWWCLPTPWRTIPSWPARSTAPARADCAISVGVSGPGVVKRALEDVQGPALRRGGRDDQAHRLPHHPDGSAGGPGSLAGGWACPSALWIFPWRPRRRWAIPWRRILEEMGLEVCGTHGTTAALALLNDAVKKGGVMASSHVGGLSGAFIPVSRGRSA